MAWLLHTSPRPDSRCFSRRHLPPIICLVTLAAALALGCPSTVEEDPPPICPEREELEPPTPTEDPVVTVHSIGPEERWVIFHDADGAVLDHRLMTPDWSVMEESIPIDGMVTIATLRTPPDVSYVALESWIGVDGDLTLPSRLPSIPLRVEVPPPPEGTYVYLLSTGCGWNQHFPSQPEGTEVFHLSPFDHCGDTVDILAIAYDGQFQAIAWTSLLDVEVADTIASLPTWRTDFEAIPVLVEPLSESSPASQPQLWASPRRQGRFFYGTTATVTEGNTAVPLVPGFATSMTYSLTISHGSVALGMPMEGRNLAFEKHLLPVLDKFVVDGENLVAVPPTEDPRIDVRTFSVHFSGNDGEQDYTGHWEVHSRGPSATVPLPDLPWDYFDEANVVLPVQTSTESWDFARGFETQDKSDADWPVCYVRSLVDRRFATPP